jgi:hypothetical protein
LRSAGLDIESLLQMVERGILRVDFGMEENRADVFSLLRKYDDQPMSLADACLVRMAELDSNCQVFTTDKDFLVYRRKGRSVIPLLAPFYFPGFGLYTSHLSASIRGFNHPLLALSFAPWQSEMNARKVARLDGIW